MSDRAKVIGGAVLAVVLIFAIAIGVWAFRVATSEVKGKGDALIQKNSAPNWTGAQQRFEELYQEILSADRRIDTAAAAVVDQPNSQTAQTNYTGLVMYCQSVVGDYNALARTYLAEDFRAADLPPQIDSLNPATDCKETVA